MQTDYDYIIAGAGCAGLSLVMHMISNKSLSQKRILLVDADIKKANDRTWCFWEKKPGLFDPLVHHQWPHLHFYGNQFDAELDLGAYTYKMIRGTDYYRFCFDTISKHPNIHFLNKRVDHVLSAPSLTGIIIEGRVISAQYVFNSILFAKPVLKKNQYWLLQHFKGWFVKTTTPVFNTNKATLMDFRVDQKYGTAFCYVLPFSETEALIEYTLFTGALLEDEQYEEQLRHYLKYFLNIDAYEITEKEFGVIPMTNFSFPVSTNSIVHIGTAGGRTKGSSGYTFSFIQKHSAQIVEALTKGKEPFIKQAGARFSFYDSVLLNILHGNKLPGAFIFTELFRKNEAENVLAFLDNQSTLPQELKIIGSLPVLPFLKAAMQQLT